MAAKRYPIGTKIRFLYSGKDYGKTGTVVGASPSIVTIYVPKAEKHVKDNRHPTDDKGNKMTWYCSWRQIEEVKPKAGQQLLFAFMDEENV